MPASRNAASTNRENTRSAEGSRDDANHRNPDLDRGQEASRTVRKLDRHPRSARAGDRSPLQPCTPRADNRKLRHRQEAVQSDEANNEQKLLG
jgi:hypothetical protein